MNLKALILLRSLLCLSIFLPPFLCFGMEYETEKLTTVSNSLDALIKELQPQEKSTEGITLTRTFIEEAKDLLDKNPSAALDTLNNTYQLALQPEYKNEQINSSLYGIITLEQLISFTLGTLIKDLQKMLQAEPKHSEHILKSPFSTQGNQIITHGGTPIRIKGVSWFGFESHNLIPHGLWKRNYKDMMDQMQKLGFNAVRIPFCNQMFDANQKIEGLNIEKNSDLKNLSPYEILDKIVAYADQIGLWIILDHHRNEAGIGASENGLWYNAAYSEARFIKDWKMLAQRYKNNPSVIGADVHNEPHETATWGTGSSTDWKAAAERVGNAILDINPHWLIIVEGIQKYEGHNYFWGGNLMGVKDDPVTLKVAHKLVYSTHDYPYSVCHQPWFSASDYPQNLHAKFREMWGYIYENNIAPVWLGELGSKFQEPKDIQWMKEMVAYLNMSSKNSKGISWSWWCWNPNSGDTAGILENDWETPDKLKLSYLESLLTEGKL
jgi:endoglucanase